MSQKFKVGDVVQLKSGGPKMTVIDTNRDDGEVLCEWFDKNQTLQRASFAPDTLGFPGPSFAVA